MAFSDFLIDGLSRSRERFDRALSGVTVKQANTQPTPKKAPRVDSLSWLAWHTAREIDFQIAPLAGVEPVWITGRHKERFALDLPDDTEDWRHTPEQAAKVVVGDISVLTAYLDDAYAMAAGYLRAVGEDDGTPSSTIPGIRPEPSPRGWFRSSTTPPSTPARPSTPAASSDCPADSGLYDLVIAVSKEHHAAGTVSADDVDIRLGVPDPPGHRTGSHRRRGADRRL